MPGVAELGFEVLPDVFDRAELTAVLRALEEPEIERSRAGARNVFRVDAVRALAQNGRLVELARSCLGRSAFPFRATLFDKSPQQNWLVGGIKTPPFPLANAAVG